MEFMGLPNRWVRLLSILLFFTAPGSYAQGPILCRISSENPSTHFQGRALRRFADLLTQRSGTLLKVEFYDGASLFRDRDALGAMARGDLEIAAPGLWQFDASVPDTAVWMLPEVYAQNIDWVRNLTDGALGQRISDEIETITGATVLGPWLDVGYGHIFSVEGKIKSSADISGKRIRVAGGKAHEERIRALGGKPIPIPLSDVSFYIQQNLIDGILSTYETVDTAGLDSFGLKTALEDREYYPFYIPLAAKGFWRKLDPAQKMLIESTWNEVVHEFREEAVKAQEEAKARLISRGLTVYTPSARKIRDIRQKLVAQESVMTEKVHISPEIFDMYRKTTQQTTREHP